MTETAPSKRSRTMPVAVDDEHPRLGRELPLPHPAVDAVAGEVVLVDLDVDEPDALALEPLRTASTTSTVGPHVRLWQYAGVAKATTNGTPSSKRLGDGVAQELRVGRVSRW